MPKLGLALSAAVGIRIPAGLRIQFWKNLSSTVGKEIAGFASTFTNAMTVHWGDGTTTPLTSNVGVTKTLGAISVIELEPSPNATVTRINCGATGPTKLGGEVDISAFPDLQEFLCNSNDITALSGYESNSNLRLVQFSSNKITGSILGLSQLTNLEDFRCHANELTGSIPALSGLTKLQSFWCQSQIGTKLTGSIPSLSGLTALRSFRCNNNQLTGAIPALSGLNNLEVFYCFFNQLTGFAGGSVSNTLGDFQAQNNQLTSAAVNAILAAFVAAGRTSTSGTCVLNLGGAGNAAPTGQGLTDKTTLISRGWTITTN